MDKWKSELLIVLRVWESQIHGEVVAGMMIELRQLVLMNSEA